MDIQEIAEKEEREILGMLRQEQGIEYEFIKVEGEGETGQLIEEYVNENHGPGDVSLVVVGTRNQGPLKRYCSLDGVN
jgi:nucleotide-binding universal stress UspA family protein